VNPATAASGACAAWALRGNERKRINRASLRRAKLCAGSSINPKRERGARASLQALLIRRGKCIRLLALHVNCADDARIPRIQNRNDDLRKRAAKRSQVTWIAVHITHHNGQLLPNRRARQSLGHGKRGIRRRARAAPRNDRNQLGVDILNSHPTIPTKRANCVGDLPRPLVTRSRVRRSGANPT